MNPTTTPVPTTDPAVLLARYRAARPVKGQCWCGAGCEGRESEPGVRSERDAAALHISLHGYVAVWSEMTEAQAEAFIVGEAPFGEPAAVAYTIEEWDALDITDLVKPNRTRRTDGTPESPESKARRAEAAAFLADYRGTNEFMISLQNDPKRGTKWFRISPRMADAILNVRDREAAARAPKATESQPRLPEVMTWVRTNAERGNEFAASLMSKAERWGSLTQNQYDAVLRNVERESARPVDVDATVRKAPAGPAAEGWYRVGEDIFKVQLAVHGSGKPYAKRLVVTAHGQATWEYAAGMVMRLTEADALTVEEAARFGQLYGVCAVCGRTLTDETSIAAGIGPVCRSKLA